MDVHNRFSNKLSLKLDLSAEIMPAQTLIEIFGTERIVIENHNGIVQYNSLQICVKKRQGVITVNGSCLHIAKMSREQLVIVGCIESVSL